MNQATAVELAEGRAALSDRRGTTLRARVAWFAGWRLADYRAWRAMTHAERRIVRAFAVPPRLVAGIPRRRYRVGRWVKLALALAALAEVAWYTRIYY